MAGEETYKEYRLNIFMKRTNWKDTYYNLNTEQREQLYDWLESKINKFWVWFNSDTDSLEWDVG